MTPAARTLALSEAFQDASDRVLARLGALATVRDLAPGEMLFDQGDPGDALYAVIAGMLEISVISADGRKLALDVAVRGDVVGEIALFDPGPRTAGIAARTATRLLRIGRAELVRALRGDPDLALDLLEVAARRMRSLSEQLRQQAFLRMPERLARKILHLSAMSPEGGSTLSVSQAELAEYCGASREAVSKTLSQWRAGGLVELRRQKVVISDRRALRLVAGIDIL